MASRSFFVFFFIFFPLIFFFNPSLSQCVCLCVVNLFSFQLLKHLKLDISRVLHCFLLLPPPLPHFLFYLVYFSHEMTARLEFILQSCLQCNAVQTTWPDCNVDAHANISSVLCHLSHAVLKQAGAELCQAKHNLS